MKLPAALLLALLASCIPSPAADAPAWKLGAPIVTYWAGPGYPDAAPLDDAAAQLLVDGGWNVAWCHESELDVAQRHGLRGLLNDPLINPTSLDDPKKLEALDALIARVRKHPALYEYYMVDEPTASLFPGLGKLVAHLRELDPAHIAYIDLFPTYASNQQLGPQGDTVTAYKDYLHQFLEIVKPGLLSYDHYQFATNGDVGGYFLNLALMRRAALDAGLPFLNIVQAATWTPAMREPNESEMRYLVYTTLAYGAQGISYYVYSFPGHTPGITTADGTPTAVYQWLKPLNHEFTAIATQVQPLHSLGAWHAGMLPPGAEPLPKDATFTLDPPLPTMEYQPLQRVKGALLGAFGPKDKPTHVIIVNLDYQTETTLTLHGPGPLEIFDATTGKWSAAGETKVDVKLAGGGGRLVRVKNEE